MKPTRIIIHHSLTKDGREVSWDAIRWYHTHTNGWNDIGYHFGIELVNAHYEILMGRMMDQIGAHAKGHNHNSIGICCVGNFDLAPVPQVQLDRLVDLTQSLMRVFSIPADRVHRHHEFAAYKTCPGKMFQWGEFKTRIGGLS